MAGGREAALETLTACRRLDAWSDNHLKTACRDLDRREAALASRLAYGVLQNRALLDFYLDACCTQAFDALEPFIRDVLSLTFGTTYSSFWNTYPHAQAKSSISRPLTVNTSTSSPQFGQTRSSSTGVLFFSSHPPRTLIFQYLPILDKKIDLQP